jgi:hypothetical protein
MSDVAEKLLANTHDDAGCLVWQGACINGHPSAGRGEMVRRMLWSALNGPIEPGKIIRCTCQTPKCINPEHLEKTTYRKLGKELGAQGIMSGQKRSAAIARTKRSGPQAKITDEDVRRIRFGSELLRELAADLGISMATVSKIRLGKVRKDFTSPWSGL